MARLYQPQKLYFPSELQQRASVGGTSRTSHHQSLDGAGDLTLSGPITPGVSMATGVKEWLRTWWEYFPLFLSSAWAATTSTLVEAVETYEGVKVSGQVASHTYSFPLIQGTTVMPSGRFPSNL